MLVSAPLEIQDNISVQVLPGVMYDDLPDPALRHGAAENVLASALQSLPDVVVEKEVPLSYQQPSRSNLQSQTVVTRVPDIIMSSADRSTYLDMSVANPLSTSMLAGASANALFAARTRESAKTSEYTRVMRAHPHASFVPIVVEAYGTLGDEAYNFLLGVSDFASSDAVPQGVRPSSQPALCPM
jgi:hypothetical protein